MRPAFCDTLRSYTRADFFRDLGAGLTVGVIALPLAIGFGIASGVAPGQGLWTAIIAGFLISALGGSRFQIGGPTGAFVPVLAGVVGAHGYAGLAIATMLAGGILRQLREKEGAPASVSKGESAEPEHRGRDY